jgi:hypothetical protein
VPFLFPALAHETISTKITWSKEVARIVYARCLECHRDQGKGFSLARYEQARPWAKAIQEEVLSRRMPPWGAVKGFGDFANDRGLTQEEVNLIAEWAEGGAPEGDPALLPETPSQFSLGRIPRGVAISLRDGGRVTAPRVLRALVSQKPVQAVVEFPDGSVEPLLWQAVPLKGPQTFVLRAGLRIPAGSVFRVTGEPPQGVFEIRLAPKKRAAP